jgi:2'-deoxynucleoside 5'-phosphate N-hydrolase
MRAYIAVSIAKSKTLTKELTAITETFASFNIESFVFVNEFHFSASDEKELMREAFKQIDKSDILFAEVSEKAIGVGVEIGYAKGHSKTIIYARNVNAEHSTTTAGASDFLIVYAGTDELREKLSNVISQINAKNIGAK